jgi:8-oxo-dGTP pyrophosphatase MutT (NUDIX family)
VLVSRRHPGAIRGGLWEFPGGKFEPGEDARTAASRELLEETGVLVDPRLGIELGSAGHHDPLLARERGVEIVLVRFACPDGASPRPLASAECRWEPVDQLDRLEWPPANRTLIALLRDDVAARPMV